MTPVTTLEQRLAIAMELAGIGPSELAEQCGVSRAAVTKWLKGRTSNLKLPNFYAVVDACRVNARWLGIGEGDPRPLVPEEPPSAANIANGLPEIALRVARKWNALDDPARTQALMLIETFGALQSENYRKWSIDQQRTAKTRTKERGHA